MVITNWRDSAHPAAGGAELYCERVASLLVRQDREVVLLTSRAPGTPRRERRDGYQVIRAGGTFTTYLFGLIWLACHRSRIEGVLDSQNGIPYFSPLVVSRSTPVLLLIHHVHQQQFNAYFSPAMARVGRWLEGPATRVVYGRRLLLTVSPSSRTDVRRQLRLRGSISVVPCGMDSPRPTGTPRSPTPRVVVVGRLVAHKRLHLLVEAMPALRELVPGAELHLVGDGPERTRLERLRVQLGLEDAVQLHGRVSDVDRDELMASAWVTANTSAGEGWGLSVLEANAAGVPGVCFRVPGLQDAVRDGRTGWLIDDEVRLAPALAEALCLLEDAATASAWSERTRAWAAGFTWQATARQVEVCFDAERTRLRQAAGERRRSSDLVSIVTIPQDLLPSGWSDRRRNSDAWSAVGTLVRGLLPAADEEGVALALQRWGVSPDDPGVTVEIARPSDLVGDYSDATARPRTS